jgi:AcrR family transcriptional regulator
VAVLSKRKEETAEQRRGAQASFVAATLELLAEGSSYADLSVEQISSRAGRTRTAFYFYFRDKRDLLMRATEQVAESLYEEADRWWSGEEGREGLRAGLEGILVTYRDHAPLLRAVVEASTYDDEIGSFWRGILGRFIEASERRIAAEGEIDEAAAHAKAFALVWMTERTAYQQVVRGGRLDDRDLVDTLVEIWERAVYG